MSQIELAERLGVSRGTINNWERGNALPRHRDDIVRLEEILDLSEAEMNSLLRAAFYPRVEVITVPDTLPPQGWSFLPEYVDFVGRDKEFTYYSEKLTIHHLAVLYGAPGIGKTALASKLALEAFPRDKIFWHKFREDQRITAMIEGIAAFLARNGADDLWKLLKIAEQPGGKIPSAEILFQYIFQLAKGRGFLFWFDDFHFVDDDPILKTLTDGLRELVRQGALALIIGSRRRPAFVNEGDFGPLGGFERTDARYLLNSRGVKLSDEEQFEKLYKATDGNAQFLILAINVLRDSSDYNESTDRLSRAKDVERYLFKEVFDSLPRLAARVLEGISIFMGYLVSRDAIEAVLDMGNVRRALSELVERELVRVHRRDSENAYTEHALIEAFSYETLSAKERAKMHQRAAEFYAKEENDNFLAASHYERAGKFDQAAQFAVQDVEGSLNKEYSQPLRTLLGKLENQKLQQELLVQVILSLGYISGRMGDSKTGREKYQDALNRVEVLSDSQTMRELYATACYGMAETLQFESPPAALDWVNRGLKGMKNDKTIQTARLHLLKGEILIDRGDFDEARASTERGLKLLPEDDGPLHIYGLSLLGVQQFYRGNLRDAIRYTEEARLRSEALGNVFRAISLLNNLGIYKFQLGDWSGAFRDGEQALTLAKNVGNLQQQLDLSINHGWRLIQLGDDQEAENYLSSTLSQAREKALRDAELFSLVNLADLSLRRDELKEAEKYLTEAEQLSRDLDVKTELPEIHRNWALWFLKQDRLKEAQDAIVHSLALAKEMDATQQKGMSLRVLGQIQVAQDQRELALKSFEESATLLIEDPYETARTHTEWALGWLEAGNNQLAREMLMKAKTTFEHLSASRDIAVVIRGLARL